MLEEFQGTVSEGNSSFLDKGQFPPGLEAFGTELPFKILALGEMPHHQSTSTSVPASQGKLKHPQESQTGAILLGY